MFVEEPIHSIVTGLLRHGGRGLLVHRAPTRRWYPDCWDLPGGHVEAGEAPDAALRRELVEELGVAAVVNGAPFAHIRGETFSMNVWVVDQWEGEPINPDPSEHDAMAWMNHREATALKLAHSSLATLLRATLT